ncbi:MAG: PASTA domain-containing protein [bacterium]
MSYFRGIARRLAKLPAWITLPVFAVEIILLVVMMSWLYITRSVETITIPSVTEYQLKEARRILEERGIQYEVVEENSLKSPEGTIIQQIPQEGTRMKESRSLVLYVSQGPEYVTVPNLKDKSLLEVRNFLYRQNTSEGEKSSSVFGLGNIARVYSEDGAKNHVILQQPRKGEKVIRGTQIDVLISRGKWPRKKIVPAVEGHPLNVARKAIKQAGFTVGPIRYRRNPDSGPRQVLKQFPTPGIVVEKGRPVSLTVNIEQPEQEEKPVKYTYVQIHPPLDVVDGRLKVEMKDRRGRRLILDRVVSPGKKVETFVSIQGKARLYIYWNGEMHKIRSLGDAEK